MFSNFGIRARVLMFEWRDSNYIIKQRKLQFSIMGKHAKRNMICARPVSIGACDVVKHIVKPMEINVFDATDDLNESSLIIHFADLSR